MEGKKVPPVHGCLSTTLQLDESIAGFTDKRVPRWLQLQSLFQWSEEACSVNSSTHAKIKAKIAITAIIAGVCHRCEAGVNPLSAALAGTPMAEVNWCVTTREIIKDLLDESKSDTFAQYYNLTTNANAILVDGALRTTDGGRLLLGVFKTLDGIVDTIVNLGFSSPKSESTVILGVYWPVIKLLIAQILKSRGLELALVPSKPALTKRAMDTAAIALTAATKTGHALRTVQQMWSHASSLATGILALYVYYNAQAG